MSTQVQENSLVVLLARLVGSLFALFLGALILSFAWPVAVGVFLPTLVASGTLPATVTFGQGACLLFTLGVLRWGISK